MKFFSLFVAIMCGFLSKAQTADTLQRQFLAIMRLNEKYTHQENWTAADQQIIQEHAQHLTKYKNEKVIILAGRTDYTADHPDIMGLIIFNSKNQGEAEQFIQTDPAVKYKIMAAQVHPYRIAVSICD